MPDYDAVIIGAGPNGLAAAIILARGGCKVLALEAKDSAGGGVHGICGFHAARAALRIL